MLDFRPEHFDVLGEGVFVPDGDTLYITNGHWLFVVTGCEHHIPMEVLKIVALAGDSFVDWRILGAREIYEKEDKYLPHKGPQSLDIYHPRYGRYSALSVEGIRGLLDKNPEALWGESYRLDQLFAAGMARTKYLKPEDGESRKFSVEPTADHYLFNLDNRLLTVRSSYFRCMYELGFNITCPTRTSGPPSLLGLYLRDVVPDVFGYLAPTRGADIRVSDDGRELLLDAGLISWYSVEEGIQSLQRPENYEAGYHRNPTESSLASKESLRKGVSILRWHGVPEDQINKLYLEGREAGLLAQVPEVLDRTHRAIQARAAHPDRWREEALAQAVSDLRDLRDELGISIPDDLVPYLGM